MPPSTPAAGSPDPMPPMPASVRVAVIVLGVLAGLLLLNAALTWYGREGIADAIVEARPEISRADAARSVVLWVLPYLVLGLVLASAALFLPRRRRWARWLGLGGAAALGLLTLTSMLAAGGVTVVSLLVLVLTVAGVTSLLARTTRAWLPGSPAGA